MLRSHMQQLYNSISFYHVYMMSKESVSAIKQNHQKALSELFIIIFFEYYFLSNIYQNDQISLKTLIKSKQISCFFFFKQVFFFLGYKYKVAHFNSLLTKTCNTKGHLAADLHISGKA